MKMGTLFKPSISVLKPDWLSPVCLGSMGHDRMVLAENNLSGLILKKHHYAELVSPGSGVGGQCDREVVGIYAIGVAELVMPQTHAEWRQSMERRQSDIDLMLAFYEERDLLLRAISSLQFLLERYGLAKVKAIPSDLLTLLTGTSEMIITLAWDQILGNETGDESFLQTSSSQSLKNLEVQFQNICQDISAIHFSEEIDVVPEAIEVKARQPRKHRWMITTSGIILGTLGLTFASIPYFRGFHISNESTASSQNKSIKKRILPVSTQRLIASESYDIERSYTGEIQAKRTSNIGFEIPGTLVNCPLREGDHVHAGDVLARLDTRSLLALRQQLLAQRAQAQAKLQELEAGPRQEEIEAMRATVQELEQQVLLARSRSQRGKSLYDQGAISRERYEERHFNEQVLRMRYLQSQKRLEKLEAGTRVEQVASQDAQLLEINARMQALAVDKTKTILKAPFSGYIAKKMVSEGTAVKEGQSILQLVESGVMEARIGVSKAVADQLNPGDTWPIKVGNSTYSAKVRTFLPNVDAQSQTMTVSLDFKPTSFLPQGETATLILKKQAGAPGFWLPRSALIAGDRGLWSTYVLMPTDSNQSSSDLVFSVAKREVEILHNQGNRVYVRGMLIPGERVIDRGTHRISTGQLVQIAN